MPEENYGLHCKRVGCGETWASHIDGPCPWCGCEAFLHPDYDTEDPDD